MKDPAFLFYSSDFLLGSAFLTMEECGQYIKALCWLHQHGGRLPKEKIEAVIGNISEALMQKFSIDENGMLFNQRLLDEMEKRVSWRTSRLKNLKKDVSHMGSHMVAHMENEDVNENAIKDSFDFDLVWKKYPKRIGKKQAERHFHVSVKNNKDFLDMEKALNNYLSSRRVLNGYIQNGSVWFNNWRDWIDFQENVCPKCKDKGSFTSTTGYEIICDCPAGKRK